MVRKVAVNRGAALWQARRGNTCAGFETAYNVQRGCDVVVLTAPILHRWFHNMSAEDALDYLIVHGWRVKLVSGIYRDETGHFYRAPHDAPFSITDGLDDLE